MDKILNSIICSDVIDGLKQIEDKSIHLTMTSPPYNVGISYTDRDDNQSYQSYIDWLESIFSIIYQKTVDGGRVAINIDAMTNRQEDKDEEYIRPIYPHLYEIMKKIGWNFRTEICWVKSEAVGRKTAWGSYLSSSNPCIRRNHEYILVWSKKDWRLNSEVPSDMSKKEFELWTLSTWYVQPETRKLSSHPAPFSEALAERVIKLFSFPQQTILDPFSGTGTTPYMSYILNRNYIGIDNSEKYCNFARNRIDKGSQLKMMYDIEVRDRKPEKTKKQKAIEKNSDIFGE